MKKEEIAKRIEEIEKELSNLRSKLKEEDKYFDLMKLTSEYTLFSYDKTAEAGFHNGSIMSVRIDGEFRGKAFFLSKLCNWEMKEDSDGILCLIPTKK